MSETELSDPVKKYLNELIQQQTNFFKEENARLRDIIETRNTELKELKTGLTQQLQNLQSSIDLKDAKIKHLEDGLVSAVQRNLKLESDIATIHSNLDTRIDDLEQHGRKMCLRIEGIEVEENESNSILTTKVEKTLQLLGAKVSKADFVRLHRSSRTRLSDGRKVAQTIVRFRDWSARAEAYSTRFNGTKKERMDRPFYVRLDLTKRRLALFKQAQQSLHGHPTSHVDSNADCKLFILNRLTRKKSFFNTETELQLAMSIE